MLEIHIDYIYVEFSEQIFQQTVGSTCATLLTHLFLYE